MESRVRGGYLRLCDNQNAIVEYLCILPSGRQES